MSDTNGSPPVLLRVSVPRSQSVTGIALSLLMMAMCAWVLSRAASGASPMPRSLTVFVGLIGLAMLLGALAFIRMLVQPPIMLDATPAGLVSYLNAKSGKYSAHGLLIPWHSIRHIEFYSSDSYSGGDRLCIKSARLYLAPGHNVPIGELSILRKVGLPLDVDGSRNTGIDWDNTVFLNAATDFGKPESYAEELEDLRKRYADATLAR
jgi:hypothetical protein